MNSGTSRRVLTVAVAIISLFGFAGILKAIEKTASVEGLVTEIDRAAKTVVVKAADGTEHTMHLVGRTVVHGGNETPETASDVSDLRPPDPHKELRYLSRNLGLTRDQRVVVGSILQERTREFRLLLDVEPLSQDYRSTLAAKVMEDSNAQIETFLKNKQKRKFDRESARDRETH